MKIYTKTRKTRAGKELPAYLYYEDHIIGLTYIFKNGELYNVIYTVGGELPFTKEFMERRPEDGVAYKDLQTRFIRTRQELNYLLKI
ncbi:MAG: hypothetical protein WC454_07190 [Phycisphaerae bacterium]|jgi:hypothetical protein